MIRTRFQKGDTLVRVNAALPNSRIVVVEKTKAGLYWSAAWQNSKHVQYDSAYWLTDILAYSILIRSGDVYSIRKHGDGINWDVYSCEYVGKYDESMEF